MAKKRFPYVQEFLDKTGTVRYYFRRAGFPRVPLPAPFGGDDFKHAHDLAMAGAPKAVGATRSPAGTMSALIESFYLSTRFGKLRPSTAAVYRRILENFRAEHGHRSVVGLQPKHVFAVLEEVEGAHARKRLLNLISLLMKHAVQTGLRQDNPTRDIEVELPHSEGFHVWSDEEVERFEARWPVGTRERLAMALLLFTGLRRADVARLGRQHVRDGVIHIRAEKNGAQVDLPILPALQKVIDASPTGDLAFIARLDGQPMTTASFGNWFKDACVAAGVPGRAHGLRKAGATRAAEDGATTHELNALFGWEGAQMAAHYTKAANRARLAKGAVHKLAKNRGEG
jgi:integrase